MDGKYPTTSGFVLQRPPLSPSFSFRGKQLHGLIRDRAENISSIPCFREIKRNVGHRKVERKRERERESVRARVSQSNKKYRLFIVYCALPPLLLLITRATQIIRGDILKFPRVWTSYLDDVMSSFVFAAYSWSATRYLGNYSR